MTAEVIALTNLSLAEQAAIFLKTPEGGRPPLFDANDPRQADEVRQAMRDAFVNGKLPIDIKPSFLTLQALLNPAVKTLKSENGGDADGEGSHRNTTVEPFHLPDMNCEGKDPRLFSFKDETDIKPEKLREARTTCVVCPVKKECLTWGRKNHRGSFAVYGGLVLTGRGHVAKRHNP